MDDIEKSLKALQGQKAEGRKDLTESEKDELIAAIGGPATTVSIRKALLTLPHERIPFLFSTIDPKLVLDVMANDMTEAVARARALKKSRVR